MQTETPAIQLDLLPEAFNNLLKIAGLDQKYIQVLLSMQNNLLSCCMDANGPDIQEEWWL